MTINSTTRTAGPFIGNGTASVFPFTFKVFQASDLDVIKLTVSTGVESTLVLTTDYTVSLNGDQDSNPGGSVTLTAGALASGYTLTITSDIANLQPTDLTNQGGFYPEVITDSLDRATIQIQQISDIGDRTLKIPISDGSALSMELPTAAVRANSFLAFDSTGEPTVVAAGSSGAPATITRQTFSGTGSQTVFTLASDPGALGNSGQVYIGGVYQQRSTYTIAGTTLTFSAAPVAGTDNIEFVNFLTDNIGSTSADLVTYTPAGSGAVARSAASKFGDVVSVKDFGAVGDGVADDTVALKAAFDYAIPLGRCVVLSGTYNITGPLQTTATRASGELHIYCDGAVTINVNASAAAFEYVMFLQTTAANNVSVTGGSLKIDCNQKAANGFYLRHLQTAISSGTLNIECPVTILNCKQNSASGNASGITVFGQYVRVDINDATIIGVERTAAGVCRGITVGLFDGEVTIRRSYIKNILCPATSLQDADGIAVAGTQSGSNVNLDYRLGRVVIESPTLVDCQGRGIKSQCSDTTVMSPSVFRKNVVTITNGYDFDFQFGGGLVRDAYLEYRLNGVTSPLGASFAPVGFQNRMQNKELCASIVNTTIVTDVAIPFFCSCVYSATALSSTTLVDGLNIQPTSAIATNCLTDDICRISSVEATIVAMPGKATVRVRNVRGPIQSRVIGYDTYSGGAIASKLAVEVSGCFNTLPWDSANIVFANRSGTRILALNDFVFGNNHNFAAYVANTGSGLQDFNFANLPVGTQITLGGSYLGTISNAPPWETGTDSKILIEVLSTSQAFTGSKWIRVTTLPVTNAGRPKVFVSYDNATTWTQLGACFPVTKTADFTVAANEDVLINNKSGSACTVTLPTAASWNGRRIIIKTIQAQAVNSASSNVVPLAGGAAGTAILTGTSGKYAELVSDGTSWIIMSAN